MIRSRLVRYSVIGFAVGTVLSTLYLRWGSWDVFYMPDPSWARIVFFPGLVAGHLLYDAGCPSIPVCLGFGIGAMGVVTSLVGLGIAVIINRRRRGRHAPASGSA